MGRMDARKNPVSIGASFFASAVRSNVRASTYFEKLALNASSSLSIPAIAPEAFTSILTVTIAYRGYQDSAT